MDESVKAALAKWPNVPDCHGWLGLDARGQWWMRDDRAQAAGPFAGPGATPASKGSRLQHGALIAFIGRNYAADSSGQWYFQNGPQRVYVELEVTPWVWRLDRDRGEVSGHTGALTEAIGAWSDEDGRLYLDTALGLGLVHSQDMVIAADRVEQGIWAPNQCRAQALEAQFGFVRSPAAHKKAGISRL